MYVLNGKKLKRIGKIVPLEKILRDFGYEMKEE
jgi:hypothetical protein